HRCRDKGLFVFVPQIEEHGSPVKHVHWHILKRLLDAPSGQHPALHRSSPGFFTPRFASISPSFHTLSRSSTRPCESVLKTSRKLCWKSSKRRRRPRRTWLWRSPSSLGHLACLLKSYGP